MVSWLKRALGGVCISSLQACMSEEHIFQSSLARFKQAQQESKSVHHLPLLMLELIRDFPKECFF